MRIYFTILFVFISIASSIASHSLPIDSLPKNKKKEVIEFMDFNVDTSKQVLKTKSPKVKDPKKSPSASNGKNDSIAKKNSSPKTNTIPDKKQSTEYIDFQMSGAVLPPSIEKVKYSKDKDGQLKGEISAVNIENKPENLTGEYDKKKQASKMYLQKGVIALNLHDFKSGVKYLKKSLDKDPKNREALLLIANTYSELGQHSLALKTYTQAINENDEDKALYYNRAACYVALQKNEEAIADYTEAINKDPKYIYAYMGRAGIRTITKDYLGAIDDYSAVLDLNKYYGLARRGRAIAYANLEQWLDAEFDLEEVLKMKNDDGVALFYMGLVQIKLNKVVDACLNFNKAADLGVPEAEESSKVFCK